MHPNQGIFPAIFSDGEWGGTSTASWIDEEKNSFTCQLNESEIYPSCGYMLAWSGSTVGHNFSGFQGINLRIKYTGDANNIRINLRNFNLKYSSVSDSNSPKFMSTTIRKKDLTEDVYIPFAELKVADWWAEEYNIPRQLALPEFTNIVGVGIDQVSLGNHNFTVERVEFVGVGVTTCPL